MKITDPSQLTVGQTIYRVYCFPEKTADQQWIEEHKVLKFPIINQSFGSESYFIKLSTNMVYKFKKSWKATKSWNRANQDHSMKDMGIIPNHYNDHQTFDTLDEAKQYIDERLHPTRCPDVEEPEQEADSDLYDHAMKVLD